MSKKVRETKKNTHAVEKLNKIKLYLEYYLKNTKSWKQVNKDIKFLEEYLVEMSIDKKIDHARMATKFKGLFFKENKDLKRQNSILKKEIRELKNDG